MAVASNSRPEAGMISAIIGGLSQGVFGGSKVNILSPTVGLATFLSLSVFEFDS
jgi:MFS superfamily sulfate permease-like transporter